VTSDGARMRVAFVITRSDIIGGASLHVLQLAEALQSQGHEVLVVVGGHGPFIAELKAASLPVAALPRFERADSAARRHSLVLRVAPRAGRVQTNRRFDAYVEGGALGRLAARSLGVPATYSPHGWTSRKRARAAGAPRTPRSSACSLGCPGRS